MIIVRIKSHSELLHERLINFLSLFFFHSLVCMAPTMFVSSVACNGCIGFYKFYFLIFFFLLLLEEKAALHSSWFSLCKISFFVQPFFFFLVFLICWQATMEGEPSSRGQLWINDKKKQPTNTNKATSFLSWWFCLNYAVSAARHVHFWFIHCHSWGAALRIYTPQISAETELRFRQSSVQNNLLTLENMFKLTLNAWLRFLWINSRIFWWQQPGMNFVSVYLVTASCQVLMCWFMITSLMQYFSLRCFNGPELFVCFRASWPY